MPDSFGGGGGGTSTDSLLTSANRLDGARTPMSGLASTLWQLSSATTKRHLQSSIIGKCSARKNVRLSTERGHGHSNWERNGNPVESCTTTRRKKRKHRHFRFFCLFARSRLLFKMHATTKVNKIQEGLSTSQELLFVLLNTLSSYWYPHWHCTSWAPRSCG